MKEENKGTAKKSRFRPPQVEIIRLAEEDIVTASGIKDDNKGEWDPQHMIW